MEYETTVNTLLAGIVLKPSDRFRLGLDQSLLGHNAVGIAALLGALATVYAVYRLGKVGSQLPPATLLLAGITIAMFCGAATMLVQYTAEQLLQREHVWERVRSLPGGEEALAPTISSSNLAGSPQQIRLRLAS